MKIENLKVGKLVYTIQADNADGEILESATEEKPRVMMFGVGRIMKSFSDGLRGLEAGDSFAFTISPDQAFGWHNDEKVMDAPLGIFMEDGIIREDLLVVGNVIKLQDKDGHPFDGKIMEIFEDHVVMDFNHPLAGHSLFVKGKVLEVREPTIQEMDEEVEYRKNHGHHCHHHHEHGHSCDGGNCDSCH